MPLSPLQAWRIGTYVSLRTPVRLGNAWLYFNLQALRPDIRRIYVSVCFSHLDGIRADAHITLLEYEGPLFSWNPMELQDGFQEYLQRFITGYSCRGMIWDHRNRNDDPWRFVMTVDGHLALRLHALRDDLAFELGLDVEPARAFAFHLGLRGLGRLPGNPDPPVADSPLDPWWQQHEQRRWRW